jgi:two-component system sensor histidine kinase HydH
LGVIGVTDGFKAAALSKVDLVSVETLAMQIGTILENTRLYSELKHAEAFRENVINSMMNGLITVDKSGTIVLANETAEKLTGYGPDGLIGMNVDNLLVDGFAEDGKNPVVSTLRTGRGNIQREAWLVKQDTTKLPVVLNTTFLLDDEKEVQGVLAVFNDITRIKRMEEKITHLDKVAALGRFSSSIAHEIRNPLTGIAAGIQYLKRSGTIPEDQQENISFILEEVARIDRLIGDIMNVVREGDILHQSVQIETIIKNCVSSLKELAEKNSVTITTEFPSASRKISVDQDKITQVIMNLIKNAVEASKAGDEIRIRVSFPDEVGDVLFDDVRDYAIIEVEDNGIGIGEDEKGKIFEPFFSTKHEGTGLGLYVTHSIIERHGGYVFVESDKGRGSTFTVYLPVEKVKYGDANEVSHPSS